MDIQTLLQDYGLSEKETLVYLALVNLGPSPVRIISQATKVNRGTTYDILKSLIQQGLVSYYNKESHQYFTAESPDKIVSAIEQKQKDLESVKKNIETNLPLLKVLFEKQGGRPVIKLYEGKEGIRQILMDVISSTERGKEKEYYVYSSANVRKNVYESMPDFSSRRIKKKIRVKTIALGPGGQLVGMDERKWLSPESKNLQVTYELIYAGKVAHISLDNSDNALGVVIENQAIYQTQKLIFEFNWNKL